MVHSQCQIDSSREAHGKKRIKTANDQGIYEKDFRIFDSSLHYLGNLRNHIARCEAGVKD
jgi:hypothetical protein